MKVTQLPILLLLLAPALGWAQERTVRNISDYSAFDQLPPKDLTSDYIYYTQDVIKFSDWAEARPEEKELLGLVPAYVEPDVVYESGDPTAEALATELRAVGIQVEAADPTLGLAGVAIRLASEEDRSKTLEYLQKIYSSKLNITKAEGLVVEAQHRDVKLKTVSEKLRMFVIKTKTVLNRPANTIDLAKLVNIEMIRSLDTTLDHKEIREQDALPNVVGVRSVDNFKWCNTDDEYFHRTAKEIDLSHLKIRDWCKGGLCVESCFRFSTGWKVFLKFGANFTEAKDLGLAMQSEIRHFRSESELGAKYPLKAITKLETPVRGVIVQDIFYLNQVFQYAKMMVVLQDHPVDANKTVASSFIVFGIKDRSWIKYGSPLQNLLNGDSMFNGGGLTAGIPQWSKATAVQMAKILEK